MLRSMTGYGRGEVLLHNRRFVVEIKSVNHRYSDITIKMPRILNQFEDMLRKAMAAQAARGKIDIYISMESFAKDDVKIRLNTALADAYVEQLHQVTSRYQLEDGITLPIIMRFPDIVEIDKRTDDANILTEMGEGLETAFRKAVVQFVTMRESEGMALKRDIKEKNQYIRELTQRLIEYAPSVVANYRARLKAKLDEVLEGKEIDESRILAEAVLFADRSCVDEELTRLSSHLNQMDAILEESDTIGRKLDFLVQEMNREVNTIGSKSNDIEITRLVVDLKSEVEKIREQIQNIE